jgi:hypothetical protein
VDAFVAAGLSEPSYRFLLEQTRPLSRRQAGQTPFVASPEIFAPLLRKLRLLRSRLLLLAQFLKSRIAAQRIEHGIEPE